MGKEVQTGATRGFQSSRRQLVECSALWSIISSGSSDTQGRPTMAHTIKVIAVGFALLVVCLVIGRVVGGAAQSASIARSALVFIGLWLIGAAINMWLGVSRAGYSVKEEIPYFLIVFLIPSVVAALIWWRYSRS